MTVDVLRFLVSYSPTDEVWGRWIASELEGRGYAARLAPTDVPASQVVEAVHGGDTVVAVLSSEHPGVSPTSEWSAALGRAGAMGRLLAVWVQAGDRSSLPGAGSAVDLVGLDEESARRELAVALQSAAQVLRPGENGLGRHPSVWRVPERNLRFLGQEALLESLATTLRDGERRGACVIQGFDGVGKSELVLEYAWRWADEYAAVLWVPCAVRAQIPAAIAAMSDALAVPSDPTNVEQTAKSVIETLNRQEGWLVVFDNAPDPSFLQRWWPTGEGHVLVTSRNARWGQTQRVLEMRPLRAPAATEFLGERIDSSGSDVSDLAAELDGLPLTLDTAGAHIRQIGIEVATYRLLLRYERNRRVDKASSDRSMSELTALLAFKELQIRFPASADILVRCSYLGADDIPLEMVAGEPYTVPETERAVADLERFALARASGATIRVHRVVRETVAKAVSEGVRSSSIRHILRQVTAVALASTDEARRYDVADLLPHAVSLTDHVGSDPIASDLLAALLAEVGDSLARRGQLRDAWRLLERACAAARVAHGPGSPDTVPVLMSLAGVLQRLGQLEAARTVLLEAQSVLSGVVSEWLSCLATVQASLGVVLRQMGDLLGAREAFQRALPLKEAVFGTQRPETATTMANLGITLGQLGDIETARDRLEGAIAILEASHGGNHPEVAKTLYNLALVLEDGGDHASARQALERAVRIFETTLGTMHPHTKAAADALTGLMRGNESSKEPR